MLGRVQDLKLENTVRVVAKEIFDIMIQQQKINFQFIQENQVKFIGMEQRLIKTQIQCDSLQKKFDQKFTTASLLISQMNQFKKSAESNLLSLTNSIYHIENSLHIATDSSKQRQSLIAQMSATVKKIQQEMVSLRSDVKLNREFIVKRLTEDVHKINQQVSSVRTVSNAMQIEFQRIKAEMESKRQQLSEVVGAIKKYEINDKEVQSKLKLIFDELEVRPLQIQLIEVKKVLDGKINVEADTTRLSISKMNSQLRQLLEQNDNLAKRVNYFQLDVQSKILKLSTDSVQLFERSNKCSSGIELIDKQKNQNTTLIKNILSDIDRIYRDIETTKQKQYQLLQLQVKLEALSQKIEQASKYNGDVFNTPQMLQNAKDQLLQHKQLQRQERLQNNRKQQKQIEIQQNMQAKQQKKRRPTRNYRVRQSQSEIEVGSQVLKDDALKNDDRVQKLTSALVEMDINVKNHTIFMQQQQIKNNQISSQLQEHNNFLLEINKRLSIDQIKTQQIQINISGIKQRFDGIISIVSKIDNIGGIIQNIQNRVQLSQQLSQAMTMKTQDVNNLLVKTRSDLTIKTQNIFKEIGKISAQMKSHYKDMGHLSSTISILSQIICITLAKQLNESNHPKRSSNMGRFVSVLDGLVFTLQEKIADSNSIIYRGQSIPYIGLLSHSLQFLIDHLDSTRTLNKSLYLSGKQIYKSLTPKVQNLTETNPRFIRSISRNRKSLL